MKKKASIAPARSSAKKQGTSPYRAMEKRGVLSDAHTPTTGKLAELLYAKQLVNDILAYHELKPPKPNPNVKCYSAPLEDFVDDADMDAVVMDITKAINKYLSGDTDDRLRHLDRLVEAFVITDSKHPAKRHHERCHKWLGLRQIERGLRAKQELKKCCVLGEYCGVVKTSDAHERDTAAACPKDPTLGYIIRDKTEAINDDLDLPDGHWAKEQQLIVDASKAGNCLSLINDARGFRPGKQPNATFIQPHDRATSELHIFLVTKRRIKKGHEILLDYGESFWQQMSAKVVWAEKMAAKEEELQTAKQALQANEKELQSKKKKVAMLEADFQGAMKLVNSADDRYLDAEQRLEECQRDIRRLEKEKQAAIIAREGELKQVRADHSAAAAHAVSLQEQLSQSQAQVTDMSEGKQVLQERLASLRASYERLSFEVHHLERAQAAGLQAARAASHRMHQDILAAEAELRAKEREQAALVAACQEHERREADMARQVALTRARLVAAESAEAAAESAKDALARDMRAREAAFAAELAAREAELIRERAHREAAIAREPTSKPISTELSNDLPPIESTKDIMARLERISACLSSKPPFGCNARPSGPTLLSGLDRGMQLELPQAQRQLPTFADLAEDFNIRHGLAAQKPRTSAIASHPTSPARQQVQGVIEEPDSAAVRPDTAAAALYTPEKPEQMPEAPRPKRELTLQTPSHARAVAAMGSELRKMRVEDATMKEEGELPVSDQDSCGYESHPMACKPRGSQLCASSARRPSAGQRAHHDRGRSRNRGGPGIRLMNRTTSSSANRERSRCNDHGRSRGRSRSRHRSSPGTQRMNLTASPNGSFSPERSLRTGGDRDWSSKRGGPGTRRINMTTSFSPERGRRKRARVSRSPGFCRSRSRCGVSERGRRIYAPHERPWRNKCSRDRGRSPVRRLNNASRRCSAKSGARSSTLLPPEGDRSTSPSNASASSRAISPPQPSFAPKGVRDVSLQGHCNPAGNAPKLVESGRWDQGGNAASDSRCVTPGGAWNASADACANNQVAMTGALLAASQNGNVLTLRFPTANHPFPAAPNHIQKGNNKYCE